MWDYDELFSLLGWFYMAAGIIVGATVTIIAYTGLRLLGVW